MRSDSFCIEMSCCLLSRQVSRDHSSRYAKDFRDKDFSLLFERCNISPAWTNEKTPRFGAPSVRKVPQGSCILN